MSTEAMKLALEAIQDLRGYRPDIDKAVDAIRTAIQQAEAQQPVPVAWMASYVDPIGNDHVYVTSHHDLAVENDMHGTPRPLYTRPAPSVPEFSRIAKFKLDELQKQGFTITGYAIQCGTQRGFITNGGLVGWWRSDEAPSVPDDVVRDAERWRTFLATRPSSTHEVVNAAIDAAMLAAKEGGAA